MTSQGRDYDSPAVTVKAPHFFKIILPNSLRDGKLRIPRRFIRKYGEGLSNLALLKLPNGAEWKLELTKYDGEVWLQKGWQEFVEYYSINLGHLLVFRYEGNSRFYVLLFDESATEIVYPFNSSLGEEDKLDEEFLVSRMEETESDRSVELLDDIPTYPKTREKSPLPCPRPHKMMRTNPSTSNLSMLVPHFIQNQSEEAKVEKLKAQANLHSTKQEFEDVEGISTTKQCPKSKALRRIRTLNVDEKARALQKASGFKAENPYFVVVMQPSYVRFGWHMNIPSNFAKRYLNMKLDDIILRVSDGRNWSVKYIQIVAASQLGCGWKVFAQDNNLDVGDVCVFELIKGIKISFHVVILRDTEEHCILSPGVEGICSTRRSPKSEVLRSSETLTPDEKSRALQKASDFKPGNPYFMVVMQPSYVRFGWKLTLRDSFFKSSYIKQSGQIVMLQVGEKSWPVKVLSSPLGSWAALSGGWLAFARDNLLQVGDVCVFELIKSDDVVLKVSIFRCLS